MCWLIGEKSLEDPKQLTLHPHENVFSFYTKNRYHWLALFEAEVAFLGGGSSLSSLSKPELTLLLIYIYIYTYI